MLFGDFACKNEGSSAVFAAEFLNGREAGEVGGDLDFIASGGETEAAYPRFAGGGSR